MQISRALFLAVDNWALDRVSTRLNNRSWPKSWRDCCRSRAESSGSWIRSWLCWSDCTETMKSEVRARLEITRKNVQLFFLVEVLSLLRLLKFCRQVPPCWHLTSHRVKMLFRRQVRDFEVTKPSENCEIGQKAYVNILTTTNLSCSRPHFLFLYNQQSHSRIDGLNKILS